MNKYVFLILIIIAGSFPGMAQNDGLGAIHNLEEFVAAAKKENWKEAKQKNGITISYRKLELFDTINTRELLVELTVSGSIDSILSQIKRPENLKSWNDGIRNASLLNETDANWIMHTVYKIPFPFSQQDLVASYGIEKRNNTLVIFSKSLPNYIATTKGVTREGYNVSRWILIPKPNGLFDIKFSAISITNSRIPRWIKDPLIQRMLLRSFGKFKNELF